MVGVVEVWTARWEGIGRHQEGRNVPTTLDRDKASGTGIPSNLAPPLNVGEAPSNRTKWTDFSNDNAERRKPSKESHRKI